MCGVFLGGVKRSGSQITLAVFVTYIETLGTLEAMYLQRFKSCVLCYFNETFSYCCYYFEIRTMISVKVSPEAAKRIHAKGGIIVVDYISGST